MKVKLDDILEALEFTNDETEFFFNKETGETVMYSNTGMLEMEEGLEEDLEVNWKKYLRLPAKFYIDEYGMMEDFTNQLPEGIIRNRLDAAIRERGAFRRFKDQLYRSGIEKQWYEFRVNAYKQLAMEWCEKHGIEYTE